MLPPHINEQGSLAGDGKARGSRGCSDREIVEFHIRRGKSRAESKIATMGFRRANLLLKVNPELKLKVGFFREWIMSEAEGLVANQKSC